MSVRSAIAARERESVFSPVGRRAVRERAEAAALAEVETAARQRREKTERLRRLRLAQSED